METLASSIRTTHGGGLVNYCGGGSVSVLGLPLQHLKTQALPDSKKKQSVGVIKASVAKTEVALLRIGTRGRWVWIHMLESGLLLFV
ncbi:hypothetical protein CRYUN_Cryun04dG0093800 [Craigia yunnanensis]